MRKLRERGYDTTQLADREDVSEEREEALNASVPVRGATLFLHTEEPLVAYIWPLGFVKNPDEDSEFDLRDWNTQTDHD